MLIFFLLFRSTFISFQVKFFEFFLFDVKKVDIFQFLGRNEYPNDK